MRISPINCQPDNNCATAFKANLWVDKSVEKVIAPNKDNFVKAAKVFDEWLHNEKGNVMETLHVRKNSSFMPRVVFDRVESHMSYAYPHEETGHLVEERVKKYEDLEFEMGNRKCGFWFDPASSPYKLVEDFKNMFNFLHKG